GYALNTFAKDTFATGDVHALVYSGALLGAITNGHTSHSYATGAVTGSSFVGALVGSSDFESYIFNSFASESVNGGLQLVGDIPDALGVEFASDSELDGVQIFAAAGWDMTNVWAAAIGGPALV